MQQDSLHRRKLPERIFHAVCFEGIATAILAPTAAWLMQRSVLEMGGLTVILATTAMVWNIIYNAVFDRLWPVTRVKRTAKVRALHALGFECGFIVIGVSIVSFVLGVTLLQDQARLLPELSERLSRAAHASLAARGVCVRVGARARCVGEMVRT